MIATTVTSKGQVTIPSDVRKALGISGGDRVMFVPSGNGTATVMAFSGNVTEALFGSLKSSVHVTNHRIARKKTAEAMGKKYQVP